MSGLQDKLKQYEVAPPRGVWDRIAAELDETETDHAYASRLQGYEASPPAGTWEKIRQSLEPGSATKTTGRRRIIPFLKYAAAAAVLAMMVWGGSRWINSSKSGGEDIVQEEPVLPVNPGTLPPNLPPVTTTEDHPGPGETPLAAEEARNDAALEASKQTFARLDVPARSKLKNITDFYFTPPVISAGTRGLDDMYFPGEPVPDEPENLADRYVVLMTPDGHIIRMSKKLGDLICCVSGEEQDDDCIKKLKKWREKVANPSTGHSPGNFMDILSLLHSLQDNGHK